MCNKVSLQVVQVYALSKAHSVLLIQCSGPNLRQFSRVNPKDKIKSVLFPNSKRLSVGAASGAFLKSFGSLIPSVSLAEFSCSVLDFGRS